MYNSTIDPVKKRLLIADADTSYDSDIEDALEEASRYIDMHLAPYASTVDIYNTITFSFSSLPLASTIVPEIIKEIEADLAAGIFKKKHMPQDMDAQWLIKGEEKLVKFIEIYFKKGKIVFVNSEGEILE